MKKVLGVLIVIFCLSACLTGCTWLHIQGLQGSTTANVVAFNAGCLGATEKPKIFSSAASIAQQGLELFEKGSMSLSVVVEDVVTMLNIDFENRVLQANIERFLGNIKIAINVDVDPDNLLIAKGALQEFIAGVEACGGEQ